jgi:hypothetical protein
MNRVATARRRERRKYDRICVPFRIRVTGTDADGDPIRADTVVDDIGAGGLYFRMMQRPHAGTRLLVRLQLSVTDGLEPEGTVVEMGGEVLRTERREGGAWGVAIKTISSRFV